MTRKEDLRLLLENLKAKILKEIETTRNSALEHTADKIELSEIDNQEEMRLNALEIKTRTIAQINQAIEKLEKDTYGFCLDCNSKISVERLHAIPFVIRCRNCESLKENKDRSRLPGNINLDPMRT